MKTIEVTIDKDGGVKIEAKGFTDASCLAATKDLEQALGVVDARNKKSEASIPATVGTGTGVKA